MEYLSEESILQILLNYYGVAFNKSSALKVFSWNVDDTMCNKGDYYASEIFKLTIYYQLDQTPHSKSFCLKIPFNSPMYEMNSRRNFYTKELLMYDEVISKIYQKENFYFSPKCFYVHPSGPLVLEDLRKAGYKLANRMQQMDFEHLACALRMLAKFHALSLDFNRTYPQILGKVKEDAFYQSMKDDEEINGYFTASFRHFTNNLEPGLRVKYAAQLERYQNNVGEMLVNAITPRQGEFNVLVHGDLWTNNIMFKYDKYGLVESAKLVDFQTSLWSSPVIDVMCLLINGARFPVIEHHFELLLQIYVDSLNKMLEYLNLDVRYGLQELIRDVYRKYHFAFMVMSTQLTLTVCDPSTNLNLRKLYTKEMYDSDLVKGIYKQPHYKDTSTNWFLYFANNGAFDNREAEE